MERVISQELKNALERNRAALNGLFDYHRSVCREPDHEDVITLFLRMAAPVYDRGFRLSDELLCSLFSTALTLTGKGYLGREGRHRGIEDLYFRMLDSNHVSLSKNKSFTAHVFNALFNINSKSSSAMQLWFDRMMKLAGDADTEKFMRNGFVTAWRCGFARYRDEAAGMLDDLTMNEIRIIFDMEQISDDDMPVIISSIKKDPWYSPGASSGRGKPVYLNAGGFSGYSGQFTSLPYVFVYGGDVFATDRQNVFRIYSDVFGVELVPEPEIKPEGELPVSGGIVYGKNREIIHRGKSHPLPDYCDGDIRSAVSCGCTVAWTMQNSYKIYIAGFSTDE